MTVNPTVPVWKMLTTAQVDAFYDALAASPIKRFNAAFDTAKDEGQSIMDDLSSWQFDGASASTTGGQ